MIEHKIIELKQEIIKEKQRHPDMTFILSIDRLDYTKGIDYRLKAFDYFLKKNPQYLENITLILLAVPSRTRVPQYQELKRKIDELVGRINGKYGTACWSPVWYFYRSIPFENLIDLYTNCGIALITPLRDGMNLVAKEYVMSRVDQTGVIILSEMAGASEEMAEALLINPLSFEEISDALANALTMPVSEQKSRMKKIQKRLRKNDIKTWASRFLHQLRNTEGRQNQFRPVHLVGDQRKRILEHYRLADRRLFFLDYDGTLVDFVNNPADAIPDRKLKKIITQLAANKHNQVVLISGRDQKTLDKWWGHLPVSIIAEHGNSNNHLNEKSHTDESWKKLVMPILTTFTDRTPGAFIEEKSNGIAWHYRKSDTHTGERNSSQLAIYLHELLNDRQLTVYHGHKVVEIVSTRWNKGTAVRQWLGECPADFVMAIGDDYTDEFMFTALPISAYSVKVGRAHTRARYYVEDTRSARNFLYRLSTETKNHIALKKIDYRPYRGLKPGGTTKSI